MLLFVSMIELDATVRVNDRIGCFCSCQLHDFMLFLVSMTGLDGTVRVNERFVVITA